MKVLKQKFKCIKATKCKHCNIAYSVGDALRVSGKAVKGTPSYFAIVYGGNVHANAPLIRFEIISYSKLRGKCFVQE